MFNNEMHKLGSNRSVIRELFEFGKKRVAEVGAENVFDFSLGNPNVKAPECVREVLRELINVADSTTVHSYTSAQGDLNARKAISSSINTRFSTSFSENNIYITCGAAASLCICLKALCCEDDEFIIFAPYFPEYTVFINSAGGKPVVVDFVEKDFQVDLNMLEKSINSSTKAVLINSPNNPSGVVYTKETIIAICAILERKSKEYNHPIFIIADEPYRELVYDNKEVAYIPTLYKNTLVCYSYSKSLSLPGERIGYIAITPNMPLVEDIFFAICGAGRALGYVCAPSLFQKVVEKCVDAKPDIDAYKQNRDLLYNGLTKIGFECVHPDGAFYLFVKSLEKDANDFANVAKNLGLLIVPGDDFHAKGYVRLAYCVSNDMIKRSLPHFKKLFAMYS